MKFSRKDIWTIPNILTYIRLLCVPVFFALMVMFCIDTQGANATAYVWSAFGVFFFAEATDIVDGYVARHFNMVSDIGKVLDPVADKLCQGFGILMLAIAYCFIGFWPVAVFAAWLILKEVIMGVFSYYFMKASKRQVEQMANKWGKIGSTVNFISLVFAYVALGLLTYDGKIEKAGEILYWIAFAVFVLGAVLGLYNVIQYNVGYYRSLQKIRASGILDTLDAKGNKKEKDVFGETCGDGEVKE